MDHGDHGGGSGGDHGGHGGHDGGGGEEMCNMNMIFNWDTQNVCVVFEFWKIMTPMGLVLSMIAIIALGASYELLRAKSRQYDEFLLEGERKRDDIDDEAPNHVGNGSREDEVGLLSSRPRSIGLTNQQQFIRSLLYMFQVFVGFFLMLIFMTYNGFLMIATTLGAGVGYYYFGRDSLASSSKPLSCH